MERGGDEMIVRGSFRWRQGGYTNLGPILSAVILMLGLLVVMRYWGDFSPWEKVAVILSGITVLALGFWWGDRSWPEP